MLTTPLHPTGAHASRRGFTLIELVVATFLVALLGTLVGLSWKVFGVPAVEVEERARLAIEANLAVASLAQDLGGYQGRFEPKPGDPDIDPKTGKQVQVYRLYSFQKWLPADAAHPYPVRLYFTPENAASNLASITVSYKVVPGAYDEDPKGGTLVRLVEEEPDNQMTVATHITPDSLSVVPAPDPSVQPPPTTHMISFNVSQWRYEGTYALYSLDPQQ